MNKDKREGISIIVPVYNAESYLERCIKSLINQTYKNLEIILVDDGSDDNSYDICKQYENQDRRIMVIHQENAGQNAARRAGLLCANKEWIGFVDSDDWVEKDMYEYLFGISEECKCDLITSGMFMDSANREKNSERYDTLAPGLYTNLEENIFPIMLYDFKEQRAAIDGHLVNKIFRREKMKYILQQIDERIIVAEDSLALYMYCLSCDSIYITHACFYHYDMKEGTASSTGDARLLYNTYAVYQKFVEVFKQYNEPNILLRQLKPFILYLERRNLKLLYDIDINTQGEWKFGFEENLYNFKIVIYGAGTCGQALYHQFVAREKEKNIVAWIDKEGNSKSEECLYPIEYPQRLKNIMFDYLIIAVLDEKTADNIRASLLENYGIHQEKIIWGPVKNNTSFGCVYF